MIKIPPFFIEKEPNMFNLRGKKSNYETNKYRLHTIDKLACLL